MKKTTKGALAAGGAAVVLLGGAGSLAYWTEGTSVTGTGVESGHLALIDNTCDDAGLWTLDGGATVTSATRLVPGDTVTKTCSLTIEGEGDHFVDAKFDIGSVSWASGNALSTALGTPTATFTYGSAPATTITSGSDVPVNTPITATITMTFNSATAGSTAEDLQATLNDIAVTVTQNHN